MSAGEEGRWGEKEEGRRLMMEIPESPPCYPPPPPTIRGRPRAADHPPPQVWSIKTLPQNHLGVGVFECGPPVLFALPCNKPISTPNSITLQFVWPRCVRRTNLSLTTHPVFCWEPHPYTHQNSLLTESKRKKFMHICVC